MAKQKDAVFQEITSELGTENFSGPVTLTKEQRAAVSARLFARLQSGDIDYNGNRADAKELGTYVSGLISNWLRKDKRLNGNMTYAPKNPGTRVGSTDDSIKAMRALLDATEDPEGKAEIQAEIDKRLAELKPKPQLDVSKLPEALRHLAPPQ